VPRAFITGITGQDGSYLAELLLEKGYEVHGLARRSAGVPPGGSGGDSPALHAVAANPRLTLHLGDLQDAASLRRAVNESAPDEIYHLAGQTHVGLSFEQIETTCQVTAMGTLRLLEIVRQLQRPVKFFHASSSEIFGRPETTPQDEQTPVRPVTPYGCAKAFATQMVAIYRQTFGLHACNGILYNHESPRRGRNFVTQKICLAAAAIKQGRQRELTLGSLTARRDWGDARDYVRGMWLALQHPVPEDFVFATGELHSVQEVGELAFAAVGLDYRKYLKQDPKLLRPEEPARLVGNPAKARSLLGWQPRSSFPALITEMTRAALAPQDS
jgi:GDPmannose 4,6-dehydratase